MNTSRSIRISPLLITAALSVPLSGACGLSSLLVIPTLFATQSRLEGCPDPRQLLGASLDLTFVIVLDNDMTQPVTDGLTWSVRDGMAEIDDSMVNPATVRLTSQGIVTIRADYQAEGENVNPAICTVLVM